jgi:hypothetical protein
MLDPKTGPTKTQNITLTPTMKRIESHMQVNGIGLAHERPFAKPLALGFPIMGFPIFLLPFFNFSSIIFHHILDVAARV